ncbi:MAG: MFS transporter [Bdellovibrionales bacterium]|nr:MFS transporter [Bdellovibrionales bacterium]
MKETNRRNTVAALIFSVFLTAMEGTVVATAMPTIAGTLGGVEYYSWIFAAFMIASSVMIPLYGKLADTLGRKPVLLGGLSLFVIASVLCGLATSLPMLVVFRVLQGLGAGALQPLGLTITGDLFHVEERGRVAALFGAVWATAGVAGPMIGSLIVEHLSWHWIFFINLPLGLLAGGILWANYHESVERRPSNLDHMGALLLAAAVVLALVGADRVGRGGTLWFLMSAACTAGFLLQERWAPEPVIARELFHRPLILFTNLSNVIVGAVLFTMISFLPLHVEGVLRKGAVAAGVCLLPMGVCWPVASSLTGRLLRRFSLKQLAVGGMALVVTGTLLIASTQAFLAHYLLLALGMGCLGAGFGFFTTPLLFAVQNSVSWSERGVATSLVLFFRGVSGVIAVGLLGAALSWLLRHYPGLSVAMVEEMLGATHGIHLPPDVASLAMGALHESLRHVFVFAFAASVVGFLYTLSMPQARLRPE